MTFMVQKSNHTISNKISVYTGSYSIFENSKVQMLEFGQMILSFEKSCQLEIQNPCLKISQMRENRQNFVVTNLVEKRPLGFQKLCAPIGNIKKIQNDCFLPSQQSKPFKNLGR